MQIKESIDINAFFIRALYELMLNLERNVFIEYKSNNEILTLDSNGATFGDIISSNDSLGIAKRLRGIQQDSSVKPSIKNPIFDEKLKIIVNEMFELPEHREFILSLFKLAISKDFKNKLLEFNPSMSTVSKRISYLELGNDKGMSKSLYNAYTESVKITGEELTAYIPSKFELLKDSISSSF